MRLRKRKRDGVYQARFFDPALGKRVEKSTRCTDRQAATIIGLQYERDAADPDHAAANKATLTQALKLLLDDRAKQVKTGRRSASTYKFYETKVGHLVEGR